MDILASRRASLKRTLRELRNRKQPIYEERIAQIELWIAELDRQIVEAQHA